MSPSASIPSEKEDVRELLFLRENILPVHVQIDRVPQDVVELFQGWIALLNFSADADEGWIPVGCVGPVLVVGFAEGASEACPLPKWAFCRIGITLEKYRALRRSLLHQLSLHKPHACELPAARWVNGPPVVATDEEALRFFLNYFVLTRGLRHLIEGALLPESKTLPGGVSEAAHFLRTACPLIDLRLVQPLRDILDLAGKTFAQYDCLPLVKTSKYLFVAGPLTQAHPEAGAFEDRLRVDLAGLGRLRVVFVLAQRDRVSGALNALRREAQDAPDNQAPEATFWRKTELVLSTEEVRAIDPLMTGTSERSIVLWVLGQAILRNSADIHFDYEKGEARFRINIDGILHTLIRVAERRGRVIAGIIRDMSEFTAPWFLPESRHFSVKFDHQYVDFRAEGTPFRDGRGPQMFTLRLLNNHQHRRTLSDLRISEPHLSRIRDFMSMPYGLVLITGPTGSGKTTTMYSAIHEINSPRMKILSVEDPIEQTIEGVDQVQVNEGQGVGFAQLLRSFLRSAPNVIFVGEIRDEETAAISLQAANTGHLVIASLHTNTACGSINRLIDSYKLDATILADSIVGLQGQRLSRALCPLCKEETKVDDGLRALFERYELPSGEYLCKAGQRPDCPVCHGDGYSGRFVLMETVTNTEELKEAIHLRRPERELWKIARQSGHRRLFEEGLHHLIAGDLDEKELRKIRVVGD